MGDGQHGWAAAEWVMMVRNLFVREEGRQLIIGTGILPEWLEAETDIAFGPTPTPFGSVTIRIYRQAADHFVDVESRWHGRPPPLTIQIAGFQTEAMTDLDQPLKLQPKVQTS
jgi:hypothetical protein